MNEPMIAPDLSEAEFLSQLTSALEAKGWEPEAAQDQAQHRLKLLRQKLDADRDKAQADWTKARADWAKAHHAQYGPENNTRRYIQLSIWVCAGATCLWVYEGEPSLHRILHSETFHDMVGVAVIIGVAFALQALIALIGAWRNRNRVPRWPEEPFDHYIRVKFGASRKR